MDTAFPEAPCEQKGLPSSCSAGYNQLRLQVSNSPSPSGPAPRCARSQGLAAPPPEHAPAALVSYHTRQKTWMEAFLLLRHCLKQKTPSSFSAHMQTCGILWFFEFIFLYTRQKSGALRLTEVPIT